MAPTARAAAERRPPQTWRARRRPASTMCSGRSMRSRVSCARSRRPSPAPAPAVARARARHPAPASVRRRQQNVDIMLQNLDKTEALENKSADLANQAKTCAAPPTAPTTPSATRCVGRRRHTASPTLARPRRQVPQVGAGHKADDVQAEPQDEPDHRARRRRLPPDHHHPHRHLRQQVPP